MSFDAEKEISRIWKALHTSQSEIGKTYFRWRQVAVELLKNEDLSELDVGLKAAYIFGKDVSKGLLPRLNWLKGEAGFLLNLGKAIANLWVVDGGLATVEKGQIETEVIIKCTRDPWPSWAKEYNVSMNELLLCRERFIKSILEDVGIFFNIPLEIEVIKSIPRGEGLWLIRLYKCSK